MSYTTREQVEEPVQELITSTESEVVHGMDDRVSLSSEDSMIVKDDVKGTNILPVLILLVFSPQMSDQPLPIHI